MITSRYYQVKTHDRFLFIVFNVSIKFWHFNRSRWEDSIALRLNTNDTVYVTPSAGGPFVAFILNILQGYNMTSKAIETEDRLIRTYHRIIESFKYGTVQMP